MNQKEILECLNSYTVYMNEIKMRTNVVSRIATLNHSGHSMTGYIETDIDLVYLQLRKITGLIMFACVVANKSAGLVLNQTLKKGYEIKKIKAELVRFNTDFFPSPKADSGRDKDGNRKIADLNYGERAYLREPELFKAYGVAGNYLHAQRKSSYGGKEGSFKVLNRGVEVVNQLVALLNHHWVNITNDSHFAVVMSGIDDEKVHVSHMVRHNK